jgi:hypothetical protein
MPVNRKQQLLAKVETSEGTSASPAGSDAILVFDPALSDSIDVLDRVPSGASLSRDFAPVGRQTRTVTFRSDFRGSGDATIPVAAPDWQKLLFASGYSEATAQVLVLGAVTGIGFQLGEQVTQSSGTIVGVIVGIYSAGVSGVPQHVASTLGNVLVVANVTGTFTAALTTGASTASTSTASAAASAPGIVCKPTSTKSIAVTAASWTGTAPAAGAVVTIENPVGTTIGAMQLLVDNGSTMTDFSASLLYGTALATYTLRAADGTSTTTITTAAQSLTPSLTIRHNLDGRQRDLLGARGDFTLEGEVGQPMQFSWTFSGDIGTTVDAPAVTTSGLSTIRPPRLLGAFCVYGYGSASLRIPTKRVSFAQGNTVNPNLDANRAGGATGSNITDRDPAFTITVDAIHGGFDWEAIRNSGATMRVGFVLGTTPGNVMTIVAPVCQVTEVQLGDSDGIATFDVTVRPRRINESGDDEIYFTQI